MSERADEISFWKRLVHAPRDLSRRLRRRYGGNAAGLLRLKGPAKAAFAGLERAAPEVKAENAARRAFLDGPDFDRLVDAAAALDPNVVAPRKSRPGYMAPFHDVDYYRLAAARDALPKGPVRNVVLVPFGKLGGADYVAGILAGALRETGPTVILRTDASDWERPDWYPADVPNADLSPHLAAMSDAPRALYTLLMGLRPKAIYNVNSRLGFDCFKTFGRRLARDHRLHAYFFCADRTARGEETGYPVWYFADLVPHLTSALIDSQALADTLTARYALPPTMAGKLHVIRTPAVSTVSQPPVVDAQLATAASRARPLILWAGRFDRQKRFDLLVAVARAMPDLDFAAWGKPVLGKPPSRRAMPPNLTLHAPFSAYDDLPLPDADGWLYTAAWDGLPTILIECGALGMPIVASAVGGVPELVDDQTGWPVRKVDDVAAYVASLRDMLSDPEERRRRATALQSRVRTRHSQAAYRVSLTNASESAV